VSDETWSGTGRCWRRGVVFGKGETEGPVVAGARGNGDVSSAADTHGLKRSKSENSKSSQG